MRTYLDAKLMARAPRSALEQQDIAISHSQALEVERHRLKISQAVALEGAIRNPASR